MRDIFCSLVSDWFLARYGKPTEPQVEGWPLIARAVATCLLSAPTGSGKTLAAFTTALDELVRRAEAGPLPDETLVVYVSPLKALTNDVRKNLETPLAELLALAAKRGIALAPIRTAVADRRYDAGAARADVAQAAARSRHDAGIAVHLADGGEVAGALHAAWRR